tara:strand:- start:1060 stop:1206 length:147 start_codon:yes stop_codon:yes gene_type:complete
VGGVAAEDRRKLKKHPRVAWVSDALVGKILTGEKGEDAGAPMEPRGLG